MHRMPAGDAAWLHMDSPTNRMIVTTVMWFDEPLDHVEVRALLQERLVDRYPRFRQRIVHRFGVPWWSDDDGFDMEAHVRDVVLPAPGDQHQLEQYVSSTLHLPLDADRPLWEIHLVDGFRGSGSAIVSRIHHCIADGVALSRVMLSLADAEDATADHVNGAPEQGVAEHHPGVLHAGASVLSHLAGDVLHPRQALRDLGTGAAGAAAVAGLVALPPDRHTALKERIGSVKQVVWSEPLQLARLLDAAHAGHVTLNDLVLSAVSGALHEHLADGAADGDAATPDVRGILPVNLRDPREPLPTDLGNRFGLVYVPLPVSITDPHERLAETHRRTTAVKNSPTAPVSFGILDVVGRTPYAVEQLFVKAFAAKGSAVITNVPGPTRPVYLTGRRVRGTIGWPPESGGIALGVAIISYDGELVLGLLADRKVLPEPRTLLDEACRELRELAGSLMESDVHVPAQRSPR